MNNVVNGRFIPSANNNNCAKMNGNTSSNIPLLKRQNSTSNLQSKIPVNNPEAHKWKRKYEEAEQRRKILLGEKEKVLRQANDLEKKCNDLLVKHESLETELFEKNEEYTRLQTASKNLYKEYETIKNQYETETAAMARALKDASHWYKENKELKRKTLLLLDSDEKIADNVDAANESINAEADIENLNKTIKQLSTEVAELQTELDALKQTDFQTMEQNSKLTEELEAERQRNANLEVQFNELREEHEQILRVSEMMRKQLEGLKELEQNQRNDVVSLRRAADDYKRERNVLAHQSTILLQGINNSTEMNLLQEIGILKRTIEEERTRHEEEMNSLQEKCEDQQNNSHVEVLEERLKLIESELQTALKRAEEAESNLKAPPAPPPPPPPPLLPSEPPVVPLRVKRRSRVNVLEIAETIGVQENGTEKKAAAPGVGVNEDIINAIKEGKFTLKKAKNSNKKDKDTPKAVSEILNILSSLRRAPNKKRQSVQQVADVQL